MLDKKIQEYKRRYYQNALLKGGIFALGVILSTFLLFAGLEYLGGFGRGMRAALFFSFLAVVGVSFYYWVLLPVSALLQLRRQLSDLEAARRIGEQFPEVADRLLNLLQLREQGKGSPLVEASLQQAEQQFAPLDFRTSIPLQANLRHLRWIAVPLALILILALFDLRIFTASAHRILHYQQEFLPQAPFRFQVLNRTLKTFRNEDFRLELRLQGKALPAEVYIETPDGLRIKMQAGEQAGTFFYDFRQLQQAFPFRFQAAGFLSEEYAIQVGSRPMLGDFEVEVTYPAYIGRAPERLQNTGNLQVPEGSRLRWKFRTDMADSLQLQFAQTGQRMQASKQDDGFGLELVAKSSSPYSLHLSNAESRNADPIEFLLTVIPDKYPSISLKQLTDTLMYDFVAVGGNIGDDYGITALRFQYRLQREGQQPGPWQDTKIPFNANALDQSYFFRFELAPLQLQGQDKLEYQVAVWDNDGVNGAKRTQSGVYTLSMPKEERLQEEIEQEKQQAEQLIQQTLAKSKQLQQQMQELQDRIKLKKQLDWQDQRQMQQLAEKRKQLEQDVQKLAEMNQQLKERQEKFGGVDKTLAEKSQQLQQLMDELLDPETRQLYEELQKLMEQNVVNEDVQQAMEKLQDKQKNLAKELDRTLALFKRLKMEEKAKQLAGNLDKLSEQQQKLAQETKKAKEQELQDKQQQQEKLNERFDELSEDFKELEQMQQQLKEDKFEDIAQQQQQVKQMQQQAQQQLQQKQQQQAAQQQQRAAERMREMSQQMQQQMQSQEQQQMAENYNDLRQIMENLLKLSFEQEQTMKELRTVRRIDPKFQQLAQQQLRLREQARHVEDSLVSLSKRVFQIQSFVTREVGEMNQQMEASMDAIRKRFPELATSKQQFAMTSINNLALLLGDILDQMQDQMSMSMSGQQNNQKNNSKPNLSDLQKMLNQKIDDLKKSGKQGRELSEELSKLAAEQEMIRKALKEQASPQKGGKPQQDGKGEEDGGQEGAKKALEEMEKTEEDLVNKRLTDELIKRQRDIMTRLLESEKAMREREQDEQRKGEQAKQQKRTNPANFDDYLRNKALQIELLKTVPPAFRQYYKQQVNQYFEKINQPQ